MRSIDGQREAAQQQARLLASEHQKLELKSQPPHGPSSMVNEGSSALQNSREHQVGEDQPLGRRLQASHRPAHQQERGRNRSHDHGGYSARKSRPGLVSAVQQSELARALLSKPSSRHDPQQQVWNRSSLNVSSIMMNEWMLSCHIYLVLEVLLCLVLVYFFASDCGEFRMRSYSIQTYRRDSAT